MRRFPIRWNCSSRKTGSPSSSGRTAITITTTMREVRPMTTMSSSSSPKTRGRRRRPHRYRWNPPAGTTIADRRLLFAEKIEIATAAASSSFRRPLLPAATCHRSRSPMRTTGANCRHRLPSSGAGARTTMRRRLPDPWPPSSSLPASTTTTTTTGDLRTRTRTFPRSLSRTSSSSAAEGDPSSRTTAAEEDSSGATSARRIRGRRIARIRRRLACPSRDRRPGSRSRPILVR
mmetsp:Transcript_4558/g.8845  ORF Transcript_4558/g.8845 Transcript_4558/m.8845 type:complete len:233 (-) Transcript_4558:1830-2528(-)